MGAPEHVVSELKGQLEREAVFEVLEDNWEAVRMFLALQTQWAISASGDYVGLNYQSAEFLFKIKRVKNRARVFDDLQVLEAEALRALRDKKTQES